MKKLLTALALIFALTLTACSNTAVAKTPQSTPEADRQPLSNTPADSSTTTTASEPEETDEPEPFIPDASYYKLPDGSVFTAPDDIGMFLLGYAFVRENTDAPDDETKWHRLGTADEWNGLWVKYAQSGVVGAGDTYGTAGYGFHHQMINFLGEKTFTGKAGITYYANGETPENFVLFLEEESGREMPFFPTYYGEENNGYQPVYFRLYHEDYKDKYEELGDLLLAGKEVTVTVTTTDFMWEYSDYGLPSDGKTKGCFNTILSFDISVN